MTHVLYGSQGSGSAAVEAALERCALPYRVVRASTWEPDSAREALARVNPLGQIPTLVLPGGEVLSESAAILIHLGLSVPASALLPTESGARARALRALVFIAANCYAAIGIVDYPERWTTARTKAAQARVREGARARLHQAWDLFADIFQAEPYLAGDTPGAADILAAVVSRWAGARAHLAASRPALWQLLRRVDAHPALAPVFARHWPNA